MAEYGANVIIVNRKYKDIEGDPAILGVSAVHKADPKARTVRNRHARVYLELLELDYATNPNGSHDIDQQIRRRKLVLSMSPNELFALADYVKSQLADTPPPETESIAPTEATE